MEVVPFLEHGLEGSPHLKLILGVCGNLIAVAVVAAACHIVDTFQHDLLSRINGATKHVAHKVVVPEHGGGNLHLCLGRGGHLSLSLSLLIYLFIEQICHNQL